jgi:hypothetical protein
VSSPEKIHPGQSLTIAIGVIGYIVKLVHIPVNNILVGGS